MQYTKTSKEPQTITDTVVETGEQTESDDATVMVIFLPLFHIYSRKSKDR